MTNPPTAGWRRLAPPLSTPWTDEVGPDAALPEYPRPQLTRERWLNLNGLWEFAVAGERDDPPFGRPLDERILVPFPVESALSGIQRREQRLWYRRTFDLPAEWAIGGDRLLLHFGAVDYDAQVWVNGEYVVSHRGGYTAFSADVTDAVAADGPQEIVVWVEDLTDATSQPIGKQRRTPDRGIFYEPITGIWQTVWLEPVPAVHVTGVRPVSDIAAGVLTVAVDVAGDPAGEPPGGPAGEVAGIEVEVTMRDAGGRIVSTERAAAGRDVRLEVSPADLRLWSPDDPYLYDLEARLLRDADVVDAVGSYTGMREVGTARDGNGVPRLTLNGEAVFHLSTLDQGYWPDGIYTAPTDAALRFDLEAHKDLGFNTVRKHIKVEPARWFHHADRLGLLVWQDMPSAHVEPITPEWRDQFEAELREIVEQNRHWTCVVAWVPFNERMGRVVARGHRPDRRRGRRARSHPPGQCPQRREPARHDGRLRCR